MAFDKYKNGAWQEPEEGARRHESGAWNNCEFAKRHKNGAWEEVWADLKFMTYIKRTTSTGALLSPQNWGDRLWMTAVDDSGYIRFGADDTFANPTVTFDYYGSYHYCPESGKQQYLTSGYLKVFAEKSDGSSVYGPSITVGSANGPGEGSYSYSFSGNFVRVGIEASFANYNLSPDPTTGGINANYLFVGNILINGRKYVGGKSIEYNYNDWS